MPRYIIERWFSVPEDRLPEVGQRSRRIIEERFPDVIWEHSHVTVRADGSVRTICIYDAPDEESLVAHARALGQHVVHGVHEIAADVTPEDFPLADPVAVITR